MKKTVINNNNHHKKRKRREKIKNVSLDVLEILLLIPTGVIDGFVSQEAFYNTYKSHETLSNEMSNWIASLKQRGYIETKDRENVKFLKVTNKGKLRIIERMCKKKKSDNIYRFLSYDIPEKFRARRNKFRNIINKLGFVKIQESLWVIDRDISNYVEFAAYECEVENYIAYIISEQSDIDGLIEKKFKTKNKK